jgi:hypothetical protein
MGIRLFIVYACSGENKKEKNSVCALSWLFCVSRPCGPEIEVTQNSQCAERNAQNLILWVDKEQTRRCQTQKLITIQLDLHAAHIYMMGMYINAAEDLLWPQFAPFFLGKYGSATRELRTFETRSATSTCNTYSTGMSSQCAGENKFSDGSFKFAFSILFFACS